MIFVINALKYDTTKMELITTKCEYKYVRTMLNMTLRYSGKNVKIFKSLKNHWLLTYETDYENCAIVRVVFVVTENFTEDLINRIAVFCANSDDIDELSFRQMVDNHYQETYYCYEYLKAGHKKLWWYIEQNDYNLYYCQNKVYTEYKNIGR